MNALDLSTNKIHSNKYPIINMSSWIKNQTANLYNVVSALIAAIGERKWNCFFKR